MTVGELKEILAGLDDDLLVCGEGYFGEALHVESVCEKSIMSSWSDYNLRKMVKAFVIDMESAGEEPD